MVSTACARDFVVLFDWTKNSDFLLSLYYLDISLKDCDN